MGFFFKLKRQIFQTKRLPGRQPRLIEASLLFLNNHFEYLEDISQPVIVDNKKASDNPAEKIIKESENEQNNNCKIDTVAKNSLTKIPFIDQQVELDHKDELKPKQKNDLNPKSILVPNTSLKESFLSLVAMTFTFR